MASATQHPLVDDGVEFPVAFCLNCHRDVMVHGQLGAGARSGQVVWHCLVCDEEVLSEDDGVTYHSLVSLKNLGFSLVAPGQESEGARKCGSGGCCKRKS